MQRVLANAPNLSAARAQPPESTRWAIAVAAFGQRLRGDPWLGDGFDWDAVLEQAQGARGVDPKKKTLNWNEPFVAISFLANGM